MFNCNNLNKIVDINLMFEIIYFVNVNYKRDEE